MSRKQEQDQLKNWLLQWEENYSPYRCPGCKSFDVEYRQDYRGHSADLLNDGQNIRPGILEISEFFTKRLVAQQYCWTQRKDIETDLREAKVQELEATISLVRRECRQIDNVEPGERDAKLQEIDNQIDLLRDLFIRIDKDRQIERRKGFGFEIDNPIAARSIKNCYDYLDRLKTFDNKQINYTRHGSVLSPRFKIKANGQEQNLAIDIYNIFTSDGQKISQLFICPYLRKTSSTAPEGFNLLAALPLNEEDLLEIKSFEEGVASRMGKSKLITPNPFFNNVH